MARLTDKNVATLMVAAKECDPQGIGYGDVMLLCEEVQERRIHEESAELSVHFERLLGHMADGKYLTCTQRNAITHYPYIEDGTELVVEPVYKVPDTVTNTRVIDSLINRVEENEGFSDGDILALFHAFQKQGYFQTITFVDREALKQVLNALNGEPYLIRELQATRGLPRVEGEKLNAIDQLIQDFKGPENAAD